MLQSRLDQLLTSLAKASRLHESFTPFNLQEQLLVFSSILYIFAGLLWGIMYFLFGEYFSGMIPFLYGIFLIFMLVNFVRSRNTPFFMLVYELLTLLLPFFLQLSLGGFVNGSVVVLWSFTSPLLTLVISGPRTAIRWFIGFVFIIFFSGILDPYIFRENKIPDDFILILFVLNLFAVLGISFVLLYYLVRQMDAAYDLLHDEQQRSESLLLNILPKEIAKILKVEDKTIATQFDEASVLYADIVGFTPLSAKLSPTEMVDLLNKVFSHFDSLVEQYGVEKIRTIGDNYMVASGVPTPRPDHANALADMALDMKIYIEKLEPINGNKVNFRIGIHCGSMIGGIIGTRKFQYDVWGDAVNIASRMESHGLPGKIHVTDKFKNLISNDFLFDKRGTIEVKGKGKMETWFLSGRN